jgi:hypothetical protein
MGYAYVGHNFEIFGENLHAIPPLSTFQKERQQLIIITNKHLIVTVIIYNNNYNSV